MCRYVMNFAQEKELSLYKTRTQIKFATHIGPVFLLVFFFFW